MPGTHRLAGENYAILGNMSGPPAIINGDQVNQTLVYRDQGHIARIETGDENQECINYWWSCSANRKKHGTDAGPLPDAGEERKMYHPDHTAATGGSTSRQYRSHNRRNSPARNRPCCDLSDSEYFTTSSYEYCPATGTLPLLPEVSFANSSFSFYAGGDLICRLDNGTRVARSQSGIPDAAIHTSLFRNGDGNPGPAACAPKFLLTGHPGTTRATKFLLTDHPGTTRAELAFVKNIASPPARGPVISKIYDYMPCGEEISPAAGVTEQVKFTGKQRDTKSGLDYFGFRSYGNTSGRFTSIDPLSSSGKASQPQSWNRYNYALNNPLRFVDPNGLDAQDDAKKKQQDQASAQNQQQAPPQNAAAEQPSSNAGEAQLSIGAGATAGGGTYFTHYEVNIGLAWNLSQPAESRFYLHIQVVPIMKGVGATANGSLQGGGGYSSTVTPAGWSTNYTLHAEGSPGKGAVGGASLDLNPSGASFTVSPRAKVGAGGGAFLAAGGAYNRIYASPAVGESGNGFLQYVAKPVYDNVVLPVYNNTVKPASDFLSGRAVEFRDSVQQQIGRTSVPEPRKERE